MSGVWIRTGTVSISRGSHTVTGAGTAWLSGINKITAGSTFWLNNVAYEIARVNADTTLELVDIYDGTDISGAAYRIQICLTDSVPELALRIAAALSYWNAESTTYLTKSDNLASLADVAMGRRNLGVSTSDAVSFRSVAVSDVNQTLANLGVSETDSVSFKSVAVSDVSQTRANLGLKVENDGILRIGLLNGTTWGEWLQMVDATNTQTIDGVKTFIKSVVMKAILSVTGKATFSDALSVAGLTSLADDLKISHGGAFITGKPGGNVSDPPSISKSAVVGIGRMFEPLSTVAGENNYSIPVGSVLSGSGGDSANYTEWRKIGGAFYMRVRENPTVAAYGELIFEWGVTAVVISIDTSGWCTLPSGITINGDIFANGQDTSGTNFYGKRLISQRGTNAFCSIQSYVNTSGNYHAISFYSVNGGAGVVFEMRNSGVLSGPLGTVTWSGSDKKLKTNIDNAASGAINRIMQIVPREFNWRSQFNDGRRARGMIAQELEQIDPLYVRKDPDMNDTENPVIYSVEQNAIVADLIAAVQEQQTRIKTLESSIASLTTSNTPSDTQ